MNLKQTAATALILGALALSGPAAAADKTQGPAKLKPGYRAVTLFLSPAITKGITTGDRVDVLITFDAKTKEGPETVTATILQNVLVLGAEGEECRLMLNPSEAQYALLSLTAAKQVHLIQRPEGDEEMRPMEIASFRKLFR